MVTRKSPLSPQELVAAQEKWNRIYNTDSSVQERGVVSSAGKKGYIGQKEKG